MIGQSIWLAEVFDWLSQNFRIESTSGDDSVFVFPQHQNGTYSQLYRASFKKTKARNAEDMYNTDTCNAAEKKGICNVGTCATCNAAEKYRLWNVFAPSTCSFWLERINAVRTTHITFVCQFEKEFRKGFESANKAGEEANKDGEASSETASGYA